MPTWIEYVAFGLGLYVGLQLIAVIWPHGWVSERLNPSSTTALPEVQMALLRQILNALERSNQLEEGRQQQPNPLGDVELITTVRRNPRRTRANYTIDGSGGPTL